MLVTLGACNSSGSFAIFAAIRRALLTD